MFPVDDVLIESTRRALARQPGLRFSVGASGTGKTTIAAAIGDRYGVGVLDTDARIYGSWHGRYDPVRHPASHAWATAPDPLGWQLALDPDAFSTLARVVPAGAVCCLALPAEVQASVWTSHADRREFVGIVARVTGVPDAVARFLALDRQLALAMARDAVAAGIPLLVRGPHDDPAESAARIARLIGLT